VKGYALDADTVSYLLQKREKVASQFKAAGNKVFIPPYVYYEIQRWLVIKNAATQLRVFESIYKENGLFSITVAELDCAIDLYVSLKRHGVTISDSGILIAAFCLEHGFTLVTNNTDHFKHIPGLLAVNWNV
jgi:predicted nucleic acid-binding protein